MLWVRGPLFINFTLPNYTPFATNVVCLRLNSYPRLISKLLEDNHDEIKEPTDPKPTPGNEEEEPGPHLPHIEPVDTQPPKKQAQQQGGQVILF